MRVVTLAPAATEIVAALGIDPVGVSRECDYPPGVETAPTITHSRIETDAASAEIDDQVLEAERAGGEYGLVEPGARARPWEFAELRDYDPEVIAAAPCGFGPEETEDRFAELSGRAGWDELTTVREGAVYLLDGNHYANRPGPRLVDTLAFLAWAITPDPFEKPPEDAMRPAPGATAER